MNNALTVEAAWDTIADHAQQPGATIETAHIGSENSINVDPGRGIIFQKGDGDERIVSRTEFEQIWRRFRSNGLISRDEVGDMTSDWAGAALFGAMNQLFDFELDKSGDSMRLFMEKER